MAYFRVDVRTESTKSFVVDAKTAETAEHLARTAAVTNKNSDNAHKIEELSSVSIAMTRMQDDGDLYRAERANRLISHG